jgi:hypothetical protein
MVCTIPRPGASDTAPASAMEAQHAFSMVDYCRTDCRVGGWIMRALGFQGQGGTIYTILVAIGGAIVLTWIYRMLIGGRSRVRTIDGRDDRPRFDRAA